MKRALSGFRGREKPNGGGARESRFSEVEKQPSQEEWENCRTLEKNCVRTQWGGGRKMVELSGFFFLIERKGEETKLT